jgi:riboflavin kinase/FMN adenylyltransferase
LRIVRHPHELPSGRRGSALAIGNFDGVHRGHRAVIGTAGALARAAGCPHGVMTFEPHPRSLFKADDPPFRLSPFRIKARHIEAMGVDFLFLQHFDLAFAKISAEEFVERILVAEMGVGHVVVGCDFVFGHKRGGDVRYLTNAGLALGFEVTCVPPIKDETGKTHSSTAIREALTAGRPAEAARLLGRFWEIEGRVEHGDGRGKKIGFPTANIHLDEYLRPANGVYAIRAGIDNGERTIWRDGVANYGRRPTFAASESVLEAHIFDFSEDLYGRHLRVALVEHLRPEQKFDGIDALKAQIAADCAQAREALASTPLPDQRVDK